MVVEEFWKWQSTALSFVAYLIRQYSSL